MDKSHTLAIIIRKRELKRLNALLAEAAQKQEAAYEAGKQPNLKLGKVRQGFLFAA